MRTEPRRETRSSTSEVDLIPDGQQGTADRMGFTLNQTFDMLFLQGIETGAPSHEDRRWFRRPRPPGASIHTTGNADLNAADAMLSGRVQSSMQGWSTNVSIAAPEIDAVRHLPPRMPYDVFAFAAHVVEQAGIYHHLQPLKKTAGPGTAAAGAVAPRHMDITNQDRAIVANAAKAWVDLTGNPTGMSALALHLIGDATWSSLEPLFESWWVLMAACGDHDLLARPTDDLGPVLPVWWRHAWRLMAIADEAAAGTAYQFDVGEMDRFQDGEKTDIRWFEFEVLMEHVQRALSATDPSAPTKQEFWDITSLSVANPSIVSVLPKVRTPSVGCTLRSLSHHLALLPPVGVVKGRWTPNYARPGAAVGAMPGGTMNLVLVPLPYSLGARSFEPAMIEDVSDDGVGAVPRFGYFDVNQDWLEGGHDGLTAFIDSVIDAARAQSPSIHGVVLPELALDYASFKAVRDHIRTRLPEVEIFVSGTSSHPDGRTGNFVAATTYPGGAGPAGEQRDTVREKHHRWKLDREQLRAYGLLGTLSPELSWWENIALQSRQVDFTVLRRDSVLAAMICEDLARVDPCQQVIRAVGPNLVVALLMDAPQMAARWPARYATVLAEDPGCAVLTLTSRGLMTLQHRLGTHRSGGDDRVVAMWRDDGTSRPIELKCPYDAQAVLLTIVQQPAADVALDGRRDGLAKAWRYVGDVPLRIEDLAAHSKILGPEDAACR